jgi:hypothetical protein
VNQISVLVCPGQAIAECGPTSGCECHACGRHRLAAELLAVNEVLIARANTLGRLLRTVGDFGECRGCSAIIWWVTTKTGRAAPYNADGTSHFATCPKSDEFRRATQRL